MAGIKTQKRDLHLGPSRENHLAYRDEITGLYASSLTGGVVDAITTAFIQSETVTSFRSGGALGESLDNPREILAKNEQKNRFPYDIGNEFSVKRTKYILSHRNYTARSPYHNAWYSGPLVPVNLGFSGYTNPEGNSARFHLPVPSWDDTYGPKALRLTRPTRSAANLSQALLELMLDLPKIPYMAMAKDPLNLKQLGARGGAEYLNVVFGWQPLVSDVLKICRAIVKSHDIIQQYARDAGRNVRRRFQFEPIETVSSVSLGYTPWTLPRAFNGNDPHADLCRDANGSSIGGTAGNISYTERTSYDYWFSGAWTYWLDEDSDLLSKIARYAKLADHLLGLKVTLETLWEIAPWSWLVDWFVNVGDLISVNDALASNQQVLRYGYLTRKTTVLRTYQSAGATFANGKTGPVTVAVRTTETVRKRANPYGFGINWSNLNVQQLAILAALGMTNGNKSARWG